jgi:hypothetical protein
MRAVIMILLITHILRLFLMPALSKFQIPTNTISTTAPADVPATKKSPQIKLHSQLRGLK